MYKKILRKSKGLYEAPVLLTDISDSAKTTMQAYNPRVYLTFSIDGQRTGKVEIELFHDKLPRTAENFALSRSSRRSCSCPSRFSRTLAFSSLGALRLRSERPSHSRSGAPPGSKE